MESLRSLSAWEYDARVRAALQIAKAKITLIEFEMDKGPTLNKDVDLRALLDAMKLKIRDTEGLLGRRIDNYAWSRYFKTCRILDRI